MSLADFYSTLRSTDHEFVSALRFLDDYAKHVYSRGHPNDDMSEHFVPRFDLEEHEHAYELYGELLGIQNENLIVEANDDHNIQISGWLSRPSSTSAVQSVPSSATVMSTPAGSNSDVVDPFVEVQHHNKPGKSPAHSDNGAKATPGAPKAAPSRWDSALKNDQKEPEMARFGDELDLHAGFIKSPNGKGASADTVKHGPKAAKVRFLISERRFGHFHRAFHFPSPINKDKVNARMENGVLHVTAPRTPMPPTTRVEVKGPPPVDS